MTDERLQALTRGRLVDQITVVSDRLSAVVETLSQRFGYSNWALTLQDEKSCPAIPGGSAYRFQSARTVLADGMTLQIVQPLTGDCLYHQFLRRFGPGIFGLRERVKPEDWAARMNEIAAVPPAKRRQCETGIWLDLMDELGGVFQLFQSDTPLIPDGNGRSICQVCIVTDDIHRTARDMKTLLGLSPWEIGHCNNRTMRGMTSGGYTPAAFPDSEFLAGIGMYGPLQFELIQPVKGPLPYFSFLNRRGIGFHHMKESLTPAMWDAVIPQHRSLGVLLEGSIGPCGCCNLDTESALGFVYEFSDGHEMDRLPDGYDPYIYP